MSLNCDNFLLALLLSISLGTQCSSSHFLLLLNLSVDEVLDVEESPSASAKILPLASFVTSLILLFFTSSMLLVSLCL